MKKESQEIQESQDNQETPPGAVLVCICCIVFALLGIASVAVFIKTKLSEDELTSHLSRSDLVDSFQKQRKHILELRDMRDTAVEKWQTLSEEYKELTRYMKALEKPPVDVNDIDPDEVSLVLGFEGTVGAEEVAELYPKIKDGDTVAVWRFEEHCYVALDEDGEAKKVAVYVGPKMQVVDATERVRILPN